MSSLVIGMTARMTRSMAAASPLCMTRGMTLGTICQLTPNLSVSQPHCPGLPPSLKPSQSSSTSAWVTQSTISEIAGVKANCGPPLSARNFCPSISKRMVITAPFGPGPTPL